mmetsp:Transcript_61418/g.100462  ORF Transcript_61418/g.100462 Transcript_61418/m.100462 type:complete len:254 (-) Transcript_61418:1-762(-)
MAAAMLLQKATDHRLIRIIALHLALRRLCGVLGDGTGHSTGLLFATARLRGRCAAVLFLRGGFFFLREHRNVGPVTESTTEEVLLDRLQSFLALIIQRLLRLRGGSLRVPRRVLRCRRRLQDGLGPVAVARLELGTQLTLPFRLGQHASIHIAFSLLGHQCFPHHSARGDELGIALFADGSKTWCVFPHGKVHSDGVQVRVADSEMATCLQVRCVGRCLAHPSPQCPTRADPGPETRALRVFQAAAPDLSRTA